ncbi:hypothetical protein ACFW2Y_00910 [Streptomyces sp. NPDC058877]|uniref:hypothetical protein n=1 Tax=Streptomyces sp. NPDC058877 TaxID=3346665 RepID=UPI0036AAA0AC
MTHEPNTVKRAYFVIGAWTGGGRLDIWRIEEAPSNIAERSRLHDEYSEAAEDAFGSVEIVYATSEDTAAERARHEARETTERTRREAPRAPGAQQPFENPYPSIPLARTRPPTIPSGRPPTRTAPPTRKDSP